MKRLLAFLFLLVCAIGQSATMTNLYFTNFDNTLLTNDNIITPVKQPFFVDGAYSVAGPAVRFGSSNGTAARVMSPGIYELKPYDPLRLIPNFEPVVFAVPNDSGTYSIWGPAIRITGGRTFVYNAVTYTNVFGSNVVGAAAQSTHSTNADNVTAAILTNQIYGSNMIGALAQSTHSTNADNATWGTNSFFVLTATLTNQAYGSNVVGTVNGALTATSAVFISTATITNQHYASNMVGAASQASHATNSDFVTTATLTNFLYGSNITGAVSQSTHSTNADFVSGVLTNQYYSSNAVGAISQATHSTNADFVTAATLTNQLYGSNIVGAAGQATHATNADLAAFVSPATLTNQVYGSNVVGTVSNTVAAAQFVTTATITNQTYASNLVGAASQATHSTNADFITTGTITNLTYASNLVGAASQSTHATNADFVTTATITNAVYSSNLVGAAAQTTHATNADTATFVSTGTLTNQIYGSNVVGTVSNTVASAQFITTATITNAYYSSNAVGAIAQATHATNADFITTGTITNLHYASNLVGAAAQATHATNADWINQGTITNQVYASNILGNIAGLSTTVASYVTNFPLTNTLYSSNAIGAIAQATHATNADWLTQATITNKFYGTNAVGDIRGPVNMDDSTAFADTVKFGALPLISYNDDNKHFYLKSGYTFLMDGLEITNVMGSNIAGVVTNAYRAGLATNVLYLTNVFLTNQVYGSNIVGAVPSGINLAAYVTNSPLTNTYYGTNMADRSLVFSTNGFATNLSKVVNKTVTNLVRVGHEKWVRSDGVVYIDMDASGLLTLPNGFTGPIDGSQVTSGTIGVGFLGTGLTGTLTNFLRDDGAFATIPSGAIQAGLTNTFYGTFVGNAVGVTNVQAALSQTNEQRYSVKDFGALGDGRIVNTGTMTSNSATLTVTGSPFTSSDVGKVITVYGAGRKPTGWVTTNQALNLTGTILSTNNANQIVLSTNAQQDITSAHVVWGTDDTDAINKCLHYVCTNNSSAGGTIVFQQGIYIVNGAPFDTNMTGLNLGGVGGFHEPKNAQIYLPDPPGWSVALPIHQISVSIEGPSPAFYNQAAQAIDLLWTNRGAVIWSTRPDLNGASVISCIGTNFVSAAYDNMSVRFWDVAGAGTNKFYALPYHVELRNITLRTAGNPTGPALNLCGAGTVTLWQTLIDSGYPLYNNRGKPMNTNGYGFIGPTPSSSGPTMVLNSTICGFYTGMMMAEHFVGRGVYIFSCLYGIESSSGHAVVGDFDIEDTLAWINNPHSLGSTWAGCSFVGENVNASGVWSYPGVLITNDVNSALAGFITVASSTYGSADMPTHFGAGGPKIGIMNLAGAIGHGPRFPYLTISNLFTSTPTVAGTMVLTPTGTRSDTTPTTLDAQDIIRDPAGNGMWREGMMAAATDLHKIGDWTYFSYPISKDIAVFNTNGGATFRGFAQVSSNTLATWPSIPAANGSCAVVNSNGFPYMLVSTNGTGGGSATWTGTNKLGW